MEDSRHAVSKRVLDRYRTIKSGNQAAIETDDDSGRKPLEGDCPICFEDLSESSLENTVFCKAQCGNNIHKECFDQWAQSKRSEGWEVTCGKSLSQLDWTWDEYTDGSVLSNKMGRWESQ